MRTVFNFHTVCQLVFGFCGSTYVCISVVTQWVYHLIHRSDETVKNDDKNVVIVKSFITINVGKVSICGSSQDFWLLSRTLNIFFLSNKIWCFPFGVQIFHIFAAYVG